MAHRPTIGLIALVLLVVSLATYGQSDSALSGACLRIGIVMGIWWFAHPQLATIPKWLAVLVIVSLLVATRWPKALLALVPVAAVLWILSPRSPRAGREGGSRGP